MQFLAKKNEDGDKGKNLPLSLSDVTFPSTVLQRFSAKKKTMETQNRNEILS
jgi:hypothetical protein